MKLFSRILKEALPVLILCSIGGVIAGIIVNNISFYISILPGILILAPAVMSVTDSITVTFSSRITSAIHDGDISTSSLKNPVLRENILAIFIITVIVSVFLGVLAHFACILLNFPSMGIPKFIIVSLSAHVLSYTFTVLFCILLAFLSVKRKKDPDDIVLPIAPIVSNVASMFFLLLAVKLITLI